jgi:hypothetical protein
MVKKAILLLSAAAGLTSAANAQVCGTDEVHRDFIKANPQVAEIQRAMDMQWRGSLSKTTAAVDDYIAAKEAEYQAEISQKMIVPVVVHVIHDFGADYVPDTTIYRMMKGLNEVYSKQNSDLDEVIAPFKQYIGNANIEFRLARKDPSGNPTNGITRHFSPLANGGDDQAKMDQWAPNRYLNIWLETKIGRGTGQGIVLAYATLPSGAAQYPYSDGVISGYNYINDNTKTIAHEVGHYLNLYHVWNSSQQSAGSATCGDDEVDDTPLTNGHFSTCPLYDTTCATGYVKKYMFLAPGATTPEEVIVDYPDTANVQNIMDYSSCTNMFTKQQILRMRETLKSPVAKRNELIGAVAHSASGVLEPATDMQPVADFSVEKPTTTTNDRGYYMCAGAPKDFAFKNRSWRDTITNVEWNFSNGGVITANPNSVSGTVTVKFSEPGWATITLTAQGNNNPNAGTVSRKEVYVADPNNVINPLNGNMQDFGNEQENGRWPMFNYYNNQAAWEIVSNTGYYDNYSIRYKGFDPRTFPASLVGSFRGDFDDFFTPAYDLSGMVGQANCNLNFMSSGVFRTNNADLMNDQLELAYSIDCGNSWIKMDSLKKARLANKGSYSNPYSPLWLGDWELQSINIPNVARTAKTFFRFRYKPSVDETGNPTQHRASGNNFYIDRINVSNFPLGMNTIVSEDKNIAVAPNPTTGASYVAIQGASGKTATVSVTDVTGKVIYNTQQTLTGSINRIEIPASAVAVKGIYMVRVSTGEQSHTEKLVVY